MYHLPCGWNKQETPCRVRENSEGRGEHCEVPHILPHEKVFGRSQKAGLLHHGRDERTRQDQPANENLMKKEVCEDPGEHKSVVPTAPEQEEHKELQLCDDEEEHGCSGDRIRRGRPCNQQERRRRDSDGLTKTGQKLFQLAVESYVYSVLGGPSSDREQKVCRPKTFSTNL